MIIFILYEAFWFSAAIAGLPSENLFFDTQQEMARSANSNPKNKDIFRVDEDSNHWSVITSDVSLHTIQAVASICKETLQAPAH